MKKSLRQFGVFFDRYYWQTAVLIARNGLARQYRNSFLGILWTLLQPLTMAMVYSFIMPRITRFPMENYALYVVISLPVWNYFTAVMYSASQSILGNGATLKRCMISSTVFPVADVLRNLYTFGVSFITMYIIGIVFFASFNPLILLVPLYFIPIIMIMGAVSIGIAFLAPYIRDIGDLVSMCMSVLFWLTPVVYPIAKLPEEAQKWVQFNPFFIMIHPIQMVAYDGVIPGWHEMIPLFALTFLSIVIGFFTFSLCRRNYVYYL